MKNCDFLEWLFGCNIILYYKNIVTDVTVTITDVCVTNNDFVYILE